MNLLFDTTRVTPRERAGFWREVVCSVYVPMDAEPIARQAFHARMDVRAARGRVHSQVDAGAQCVRRDAAQISRTDERDIYTFMVQHSGTCGVEQAGACALLLPGDMLLFHNSRPYRLRFDRPFRQTVIQAPRSCVGPLARDLDRRLAQRVQPSVGFGRVLQGFAQGLDRALPEVDDTEAAVLIDELFHLLAAHSTASGDGPRDARRALVERAQRDARERIADPDLSVETLARAQRVSPRSLQRAFAGLGTGAMRWLRDERLARCAAALSDPAWRARSIADIALAHGFRDVPAFGRSFKARYGQTPGDWRLRGWRG
ncbi:MAG TPA: helix-turn-helix domain-containing protein [Burkholderiaceae bacterium]|nr:helix-turn-helix domain-containing protein [Burkholderiaceae bacterium]